MFGHQDDKHHHDDDEQPSDNNTTVTPDDQAAEAVDTGAEHNGQADDQGGDFAIGSDDAPVDNTQDDNAWQHPGAPLPDQGDDGNEKDDKTPEPIKDIVGNNAGPDFKPLHHDDDSGHTDNTPHELIGIKQKALSDLAPLVGKLDQSPEEKFRTIMMMIQASDDQGLLEQAYKAAHEIKDEKTRAQALLDIVNEINYFTQHPEN